MKSLNQSTNANHMIFHLARIQGISRQNSGHFFRNNKWIACIHREAKYIIQIPPHAIEIASVQLCCQTFFTQYLFHAQILTELHCTRGLTYALFCPQSINATEYTTQPEHKKISNPYTTARTFLLK